MISNEKAMGQSWILEYEKCMFSSERTLETMRHAENIKNEHLPDCLYKYRTLNSGGSCLPYSLEALNGGVLYASPPFKFNDVFECPISFQIDKLPPKIVSFAWTLEDYSNCEEPETYGELFSLFQSKFPEASELEIKIRTEQRIRHAVLKYRNRYTVISLASSNDNELMWAHYADNSTGFCIGYDFRSVDEIDPIKSCLLPVIYRDNAFFDINEIMGDEGSKLMHALSIKSAAWQYEQEWRMFYFKNIDGKSLPVKMPNPKAVYLGAKFDLKWLEAIINICLKNHIPIYKMTEDVSNHKLIPDLFLDCK